jgi:hypothetical protein
VSVENSKPLPEYEMAAKIGTAAGFALGRIMREFDVGLTYAEQTAACGIIAEAIESVLAFTRAPQEAAAETEYAKRLAGYLWRTHYKETAPNWEPFDDLMGLLSQIDNMTCRLVLPAPTSREAAAAEGEDLRQFGYAPGDYLCLCKICHSQYPGDKRSWNCEKCAAWLDAIRSQAATKALAAVKTEIEADREKLRANGMGYKSDGAGYTRSIMLINEALGALSPQTQNKEEG